MAFRAAVSAPVRASYWGGQTVQVRQLGSQGLQFRAAGFGLVPGGPAGRGGVQQGFGFSLGGLQAAAQSGGIARGFGFGGGCLDGGVQGGQIGFSVFEGLLVGGNERPGQGGAPAAL